MQIDSGTKGVVVLALAILTTVTAHRGAHATWTFGVLGGSVYSVRTPLTIVQSGFDAIDVRARYEGKPLEPPPYYVLRIGTWKGRRGWELEFIHEKLYLKNKPPEVQRFSVTHGYNHVLLNRAWRTKEFVFRLGAGIVIPHPETTIRGRRHSERKGLLEHGYYLSGPSLQTAVGRRFRISSRLIGVAEGKVCGSYARIPIQDGHADVTHVAIHGLIGLGYRF